MIDTLKGGTAFIGRKYPSRASELSAHSAEAIFPDSSLQAYLRPATSGPDSSVGWPGFGNGQASATRGKAINDGRGDIESMARACEKYFEWGTVDGVCKKFAGESSVFKAALIDDARALTTGDKPGPSMSARSGARSAHITSFFNVTASQPRTPHTAPQKYLTKIYMTRDDPTDTSLTEYRVGYMHKPFADRCRAAMAGHRVAPLLLDAEERTRLGLVDANVQMPHDLIDPELEEAADVPAMKDEMRVWLPEYLVRQAWPALVATWDEAQRRKPKKGSKKQAPSTLYGMGLQAQRAVGGVGSKPPPSDVEDDTEVEEEVEEVEEVEEAPSLPARRRNLEVKRNRSALSASTISDEQTSRPAKALASEPASSAGDRAPKGQGRRNVVRSPSPSKSSITLSTSPSTPPPSSPLSLLSSNAPSKLASSVAPLPAKRFPDRKFSRIRSAPEPARPAPMRLSTRQNSAAPVPRAAPGDIIDLCSSDDESVKTSKPRPASRRRRSLSAAQKATGISMGKNQPSIASYFNRPPSTPTTTLKPAKTKQSPQWSTQIINGIEVDTIDMMGTPSH
ncbi:hypothetical protein Q5752_002859 [Cryptotrichosporon argae]